MASTASAGTVNGARPIISARNLHKVFQQGESTTHVLRGVNISIPAGQFVGVMGPSGSGKSTLMYLLGGLDQPTEGMITVTGRRLDTMTSEELAHFRRDSVGFIFQSYHLIPMLTALENAAFPGLFAGIPREAREERALRLLRSLGMENRASYRPWQLSGGQQQRVAIARALFNSPPIIMGDEPTGALDSKTGKTVLKLLQALSRRQGKTILIVSHDMGIAEYADRMLLLRDGVIVDDYLTENARTPTTE